MYKSSDVSISFDKIGYETFCGECDKLNLKLKNKIFNFIQSCDKIYENNGEGITICWDKIEWNSAIDPKKRASLSKVSRYNLLPEIAKCDFPNGDMIFIKMFAFVMGKDSPHINFSFHNYNVSEDDTKLNIGAMDHNLTTSSQFAYNMKEQETDEAKLKLPANKDCGNLTTHDFLEKTINDKKRLHILNNLKSFKGEFSEDEYKACILELTLQLANFHSKRDSEWDARTQRKIYKDEESIKNDIYDTIRIIFPEDMPNDVKDKLFDEIRIFNCWSKIGHCGSGSGYFFDKNEIKNYILAQYEEITTFRVNETGFTQDESRSDREDIIEQRVNEFREKLNNTSVDSLLSDRVIAEWGGCNAESCWLVLDKQSCREYLEENFGITIPKFDNEITNSPKM